MIVAPHPDDEVLAAGGVIAAVLNSSDRSQIRVIVATNGDASYATAFFHGSHFITKENFKRQAVMRQQESLKALASLGLDAEHVYFWGFPDRGLASLWKSHWDNEPPYRSSTTGYDHSVQALNSPLLPFTRASLDVLFRDELIEFRPTTIIMPHPQDRHSDHSALAGFTLHAIKHYHLDSHLPLPLLLAYWMWNRTKPWLTGTRPHDIAQLSAEADPANVNIRRLRMSPAIHEQKARALQCYPSQKIAAGRLFRESTRKAYETFAVLQPAL